MLQLHESQVQIPAGELQRVNRSTGLPDLTDVATGRAEDEFG